MKLNLTMLPRMMSDEWVFWYYSCEGDEHGFDPQKIPEDVLEKIIGTGTWEETMAENGFLVLFGIVENVRNVTTNFGTKEN